MSRWSLNFGKAETAPGEWRRLLWIVLILLLLTLPNAMGVVLSESPRAALVPWVHGLSLLLLPCAFGLRVRPVLRFWLPVALLAPAAAAYVASTRYAPNEWAVLALLETSRDELSSFAAGCIAAGILTPLLVWGCWTLIRCTVPADYVLSKVPRLVVTVLALLLPVTELATLGLSFGWEPELDRLGKTYPFGAAMAVARATQIRSQLVNRDDLKHDLAAEPEPAEVLAGRRDLHVLMLGETCRYGSFSLHGYERPTSPRLQATPGLLDFTNVVAPASYTSLSVPMILTPAEPGTHEQAARMPSIASVFRAAGYKVYWLSTQMKHGFGDTSCSLYAQDADAAEFLSGKVDATGVGSYASVHDSALVPAFRQVLARQEPRVLVILHSMGSHSNYADRYPPEFEKYPVDRAACPVARMKPALSDEDRKNLLNAYDNSILFTDYVLAELIGVLREQDDAAASFCFIPDHGENGGDAAVLPFAHGTNSVDVLHVPMFLWLSPGYEATRTAKASTLRARLNEPFSAANTFHTIIDLAGIRSPVLQPSKSLCSAMYHAGARHVVSGDGRTPQDYDQFIAGPAMKRGGWKPLFPKATVQR